MLILMHQHIKNAPGKLMNILLKPCPKILTHRKKINSPENQDSVQGLPMPLPGHELFFPSF